MDNDKDKAKVDLGNLFFFALCISNIPLYVLIYKIYIIEQWVILLKWKVKQFANHHFHCDQEFSTDVHVEKS